MRAFIRGCSPGCSPWPGGQVCQCVAFSQHPVKFHTAAEGFSIAATIVLEFSLAPDLTGRKHHFSNSDDSNSPDADQ